MSAVDLCVIGAGSGGLSVAAGAARFGLRTVLVEAGEMGGDCLNTGCVPSKALLAAAAQAQAVRDGGRFGIRAGAPEIDWEAVQAHVRGAIAAIAPHDSQERFEAMGVEVIRDVARFEAPDAVRAGGRTIRARRFVIATGSRPAVPQIPGLADAPHLTNETVFGLAERPRHLVVLGGGPIGMEMAQAHRRLGAEVTVIEAARALAREDAEAAAVVCEALRREGVRILESTGATAVRQVAEGIAVDTAAGPVAGSHLLVAAGRIPDLARLDLAAGGIDHGRGITVGPGLRSVSNRRVYVVGDAAGGAQFTHLAGYHASVVLRQVALGLPARASEPIPRVTYTDPELAQVGLNEAEARARHGAGVSVERAPFAENDRAVAEARREGFLKLVLHRGRPVGATLVGHGAGDLVGTWTLALSSGVKLAAIAGMVAPYPTRGETAKRAAGAHFAPRLFGSNAVRRAVAAIQHYIP